VLGIITKELRDACEDITREPLPPPWADLVNYLNEQERKRSLSEAGQRKHGDERDGARTKETVIFDLQ
jgi:hypothetical protein